MKYIKLSLITLLIVLLSHTPAFSNDDNHIYLNFTRKEVCSDRARKCWPVALGNSSNPTPFIEGPTYVLDIRRNGFTWSNPFTGKVYRPGTHNLGNIWVQYTQVDGIHIGFHQTPYPSIPLSQQQSRGGCIRMSSTDIKEFASYVRYLDEIYSIREQTPTTY